MGGGINSSTTHVFPSNFLKRVCFGYRGIGGSGLIAVADRVKKLCELLVRKDKQL